MDKIMTLKNAVKKYVHPKSHIAWSGFPLARKPAVFAKEIIRQHSGDSGLDLTISGPGVGDTGNGLLVASGLVESAVSSYVSMEGHGANPNLRRSLCEGVPRRIKHEDCSNLSMNMKYLAGGLHIPFIPSHSGKSTDMRKHGWSNLSEAWGETKDENSITSNIRYTKMPVIEDPFGSREEVALLQALNPDLGVLHVPLADKKGNAIILGAIYYDAWLPHSARDVVVVTDRIVETECCLQFPNLVTLPGAAVDAVVPWYMGAWPHNCPGFYGQDPEAISEYQEKCKTQEGAEKYMEKYVFSWDSHEEYMDLIGENRVKKLEDDPTTKLIQPFKKWITEK